MGKQWLDCPFALRRLHDHVALAAQGEIDLSRIKYGMEVTFRHEVFIADKAWMDDR